MDIKAIEEEIYDFVDEFFLEYTNIIEYELGFIEKNNLITPKHNYLIIFDFLNKLVVSFRNLDYTRVDGVLKKLYLDINNFHKLYENINEYNTQDIFNNKMMKKSNILNPYIREILRLKSMENISQDDKKILLQLSKKFKTFKNIYYKVFYEIFEENKSEVYKNITYILNSKLYYLDKLIWSETSESLSIQRHYRTIGLDFDMNSKKYIEKKLSVLMPQTGEYDYLKECLRIYK